MNKADLDELVAAKLLTATQRAKIDAYYASHDKQLQDTSSSLSNTLYYIGGFLIVFAISYFLGTNWEQIGHSGRIICSGLLMAGFGALGIKLLNTPYRTGGAMLLLCAAVALPLFIYSVELATGIWPNTSDAVARTFDNFLTRVSASWLLLDILTLIGLGALFYKYREPILTLPLAHFFWFAVLDATNIITGSLYEFNPVKAWISILAGVGLVLWGVVYSKHEDSRIGVWPYLYGLLIILGSLIALRFDTRLEFFYQLLIGVFGIAVLFAATPLKSKTFLIIGALALFWFIQDITWEYFTESLGYTLVLIISGLLTIGAGIAVQRYYKQVFHR